MNSLHRGAPAEQWAAWAAVALLWPVALLNYLDRQMLATMRLSMQGDIVELRSAESFGQLMAVFMWVYALSSPLGGVIADRFSKKWLIVASLGVWSAVTLLMGHAQDFHALYGLRAAMGLSEAFYLPAALALLAEFHRGSSRSLAIGVHMSGIYIGQALGGVGGWIAQDVSWHAAFFSCGLAGVVYCAVLIAFLRERRDPPEAVAGAPPRGLAPIQWAGFAVLLLCFTLPSLPGWAVKNWLPTLLQDRFILDQKTSGMAATLCTALAGLGGVLCGGRLADAWARRALSGRTRLSALGLLLLAPALLGMGFAPRLGFVLGCAALYGFGFGLFDANNMPILCQFLPVRWRATGYGCMNTAGIAAGAWLTPLLGKLKDHGVPLAAGFALSAAPALAAAGAMFLLRPRLADAEGEGSETG